MCFFLEYAIIFLTLCVMEGYCVAATSSYFRGEGKLRVRRPTPEWEKLEGRRRRRDEGSVSLRFNAFDVAGEKTKTAGGGRGG